MNIQLHIWMHLSRHLGVQIHKISHHSVHRDFPWDTTANQVQLNNRYKKNSVDNLIEGNKRTLHKDKCYELSAWTLTSAFVKSRKLTATTTSHPFRISAWEERYFKNIRSINSHQLVKSYTVAVSSQSMINMSNPHQR